MGGIHWPKNIIFDGIERLNNNFSLEGWPTNTDAQFFSSKNIDCLFLVIIFSLKTCAFTRKILVSLLFKMSVIPNVTTAVYNRFGEIIRQKSSVIHSLIRTLCRRLTAFYLRFCLQAPYTSIFSENTSFFKNEQTGNRLVLVVISDFLLFNNRTLKNKRWLRSLRVFLHLYLYANHLYLYSYTYTPDIVVYMYEYCAVYMCIRQRT